MRLRGEERSQAHVTGWSTKGQSWPSRVKGTFAGSQDSQWPGFIYLSEREREHAVFHLVVHMPETASFSCVDTGAQVLGTSFSFTILLFCLGVSFSLFLS